MRDSLGEANGGGVPALLSLGANIGDRAAAISRAIDAIRATDGISVVQVSPMYETAPVGYLAQPSFINSAVLIESTLAPEELLSRLREIESRLGRVSRERWHEREIDIDILLFGDHVIDSDELSIPHHEMHRRRFVLVPANDIAPDAVHPLLNHTVSELLSRCADMSSVVRIEDQSAQSS